MQRAGYKGKAHTAPESSADIRTKRTPTDCEEEADILVPHLHLCKYLSNKAPEQSSVYTLSVIVWLPNNYVFEGWLEEEEPGIEPAWKYTMKIFNNTPGKPDNPGRTFWTCRHSDLPADQYTSAVVEIRCTNEEEPGNKRGRTKVRYMDADSCGSGPPPQPKRI